MHAGLIFGRTDLAVTVLYFRFRNEASDTNCAGDEIKLRHASGGSEGRPWSGIGQVVRLSDASEEITLELRVAARAGNAFTSATTGWTVELVWRSTSFDRMQRAMKLFAVDDTSVSSYLYHK